MFDMEADRIRDLAFDPKIIESERGVVYSERRSSVDNSNGGMLRELAYATAFIAHPYHWPVVGWPSDIEAWSMDDLKTHFRMGYAPNNCTLVLVGRCAVRPGDGAARRSTWSRSRGRSRRRRCEPRSPRSRASGA